MKLLQFIIIVLCSSIESAFAQDTLKLKLGDKAPSLVLPTTLNTVQSFSFPYNNRIVLLVFWSSSVSKSKENLFKYSIINAKYSSLPFKNSDGFDIIAVTLQSDRKIWEEDVKKYNLGKINNCIALKGYKDFFVKTYHLTETPSSFLIDESGKIIFINPDIETLVEYLDERKNTLPSSEAQNSISGKILYGDGILKPLINKKITILNNKNDTLEKIKTNETGAFHAKNPKTANEIILKIEADNLIKEGEAVFLATENGENIANLNFSGNSFEYKLYEVDRMFLKPLKENDANSKSPKDLNFTDNLFKSGGFALSPDAKQKLNSIVVKLNQNPTTRLEIISHTDSKGDAKLNLELSNKRSKIIFDYLITKGVSKTRLSAIGKGETELLNKCADGVPCSVKENDLNIRTEFKFYTIE